MSSNDNMENDCNGQLDNLEKESRKKYSCPECDKVFQHCSSFSRYRNSHNQNVTSDYECKTCFKNFSKKDVLKKHIISGRCKPEKSFEFKCGVCSKVFNRKCNYVRHVENHKKNTITHKCKVEGYGKTYLRIDK